MPASPDKWLNYYHNLVKFIKKDETTIVMGDFSCYYNGLIDAINGTLFSYKNKNILQNY